MTTAAVLEVLVSLSVQVTLLVAVTVALVSRTRDERVVDRSWASCQRMILLLVGLAFLAPRLRLVSQATFLDRGQRDVVAAVTDQLGTALVAVWLFGVAVALLLLVMGLVRSGRLLREAVPIEPKLIPAIASARTPAAAGTGTREARWLVSAAAGSPFCWQIHRPTIVLPEFVLQFPQDELAAVVRHELAHLRAGHPMQLFLQRLTEVLLWFHPAVWFAARRATASREFVSDAEAAPTPHDAAACLRSLLRLAEQSVVSTVRMPAGLGFGARPTLTRLRADRLAADAHPAASSPPAGVLLAGLLLAFLAVATVRLPLDARASDRSVWSPWPTWSARALHAVGLRARDYEIDNHRLEWHFHD